MVDNVCVLSTFCHGFMVLYVKLMLSKFLHLWFFLQFDCFVRRQNVTCMKHGHYTSEVGDIIIARLAIFS